MRDLPQKLKVEDVKMKLSSVAVVVIVVVVIVVVVTVVGDSGGCDVSGGCAIGDDSSMKKMNVREFCFIVLRLKVPRSISSLAGKP